MNWDLSGRFYHYMGMYAPPVPADGEWLNRWNPFGATGGRLTYNVSYASQDALYAQAQALGFATLSYWNLFEFGMNVYPVHKNLPSPVTPGPNDFRNATLYLSNNLADAMLRANWNYQDKASNLDNPGAWDGGVVMDPGVDSYTNEMVAQAARSTILPHFQGIVVDRSDYARYYNLEHNDGVSYYTGNGGAEGPASSLKKSYIKAISAIRQVFGDQRIILMNSLGYSCISLMVGIDGTFSEGRQVSAVGILGSAGMVSILWTEHAGTEEQMDSYFQRHLYLGVHPMAPLPAADHCISDNCGGCQAWYQNYGTLFASMQGKRWFLAPHAVNVMHPPGAKANAFQLRDGRLLYPLVFVNGTSAAIHIEGVSQNVSGFEALFVGSSDWVEAAHVIAGPGAFNVSLTFSGKRSSDAAMIRSVF